MEHPMYDHVIFSLQRFFVRTNFCSSVYSLIKIELVNPESLFTSYKIKNVLIQLNEVSIHVDSDQLVLFQAIRYHRLRTPEKIVIKLLLSSKLSYVQQKTFTFCTSGTLFRSLVFFSLFFFLLNSPNRCVVFQFAYSLLLSYILPSYQ